MAEDPNFFAMPPAEDAPVPPEGGEDVNDGGFTLLGDAPTTEAAPAFVGDVNEAPPADMGFAGAPADAFAAPPADDAFAAPPADMGGYEAPPDAFAAPPPADAPIILGAPAPEGDGDGLAGPVDDDAVPAVDPSVPSEPTPMQKWNNEWQETLAARKDEENAKKAELVENSRLAMEKFQKDRETRREAKMAKNREDEQAKLEAIEADLENDNSWQRVCKMVELTHDGVDSAEDTKRMRDVLILLKNEPSRASAVGA